MRWTSIFRAHLAQSLRSPWAFFFIIAAILISLGVGLQAAAPRDERFRIAVVNEDQGDYGRRLTTDMDGYDALDLVTMGREEALGLLRRDRLEGVFIIRPDFTAKLRECDYEDIVEWYTAPSTRAAATVSEPLINNTMRIWLEEKAISSTREFLAGKGVAYTAADEQAQRELIAEIWQVRTSIEVVDVLLDDGGSVQPAETGEAASPLDACVRWYGVLCVFYLIIGASWVLDINKRGLRIRAVQSGGRLWQILLGTSLAPLLIGFAGYWAAGSLCCLLTGGGWLRMLSMSLPMLVYLWTALGLTIFLASFLRQPMALMFLAPLLTFVNALLSGLIADLPAWAGILVILSRALPGRWLINALTGTAAAALPGALLCCAGWFAAGILLSETRQLRRSSGS